MARAKLRTKTGCLGCRRRKKKCDEATPTCQGCEVTGHECIWPAPADKVDRRFASHSQSRHHGISAWSKTRRSQYYLGPGGSPEDVDTSMSQSTGQAMVNDIIGESMEIFVFRHFIDKYCGLILLPWCHRSFREGWQNEILGQTAVQKSLYYSAMACAASHIHLSDNCEWMHQISLWFYSNAITRLGSLLMRNPRLDHDGLFSSVLLLAIHGHMGKGTISDIPQHLNAAASILELRMQNHTVSVNTPVGTLAAESVLYHMFHVMTGLWSEEIEAGEKLTIGFWIQIEGLLHQATSQNGSSIINSPVLGVPAPLLRLALMLRRHYYCPTWKPHTHIENIEGEVLDWESFLNDKNQPPESQLELADRYEQYCEDATSLYIIVVSLLFRQANDRFGEFDRKIPGLPSEAAQDSWHTARAIRILKKYEADDGWAGCYIGTWPTYTLGFLVSTAKDRETIRADLQRRWHLTRLTQATRYVTDLQVVWASRACAEQ